MGSTKLFLKSKTLLGALALALSLVARASGVEIDPDDPQLTEFASAALDLIGLGLVVYGRLTATKRLSVLPPGKGGAQ